MRRVCGRFSPNRTHARELTPPRFSAHLCTSLHISAHLCTLMHIYAHLCTSMHIYALSCAYLCALLRSCARLSTSLRSPSHLCAPLRRAALCVLHATKPTRTLYIHPLYMFVVCTRSSYLWTLLYCNRYECYVVTNLLLRPVLFYFFALKSFCC